MTEKYQQEQLHLSITVESSRVAPRNVRSADDLNADEARCSYLELLQTFCRGLQTRRLWNRGDRAQIQALPEICRVPSLWGWFT